VKSFYKTLLIIFLILIVGAVSLFYYALKLKNSGPRLTPIETPTATSTVVVSFLTIIPTASSTIVDSSWKSFTDASGLFDLSYPSNLLTQGNGSTTVFVFSKDTYFHWPLQDDVQVTVGVGLICPEFGNGEQISSSTVVIGENKFLRQISQGVGAGNIYNSIGYSIKSAGKCYYFNMLDHGARGADLYVDDQDLISKYNNQREIDMQNVVTIFNSMISSVHLH